MVLLLNFHKKPDINIKNGNGAELKPIIFEGKISSVQVTNGGSDYSSAPTLKLEEMVLEQRLEQL